MRSSMIQANTMPDILTSSVYANLELLERCQRRGGALLSSWLSWGQAIGLHVLNLLLRRIY